MRPPSGTLFRHTATVTRRAWGKDASFGRTPPTSPATVTLACLLQATGTARADGGKRDGATTEAQAFFPADPAVVAGDLVEVGGATYVVDGPAEDMGGQAAMWRVPCTRRS